LYDYHRRVVLEARQLSNDPAARDIADWWLSRISVPTMSSGFNSRYDLLGSNAPGNAPTALIYHAAGTGHLFARTGWDRDAMWMAFVAGPYEESHAHQDQGSFTLFARDWLAVTANIWSRSGIQQASQLHNMMRFERADRSESQCQGPQNDTVVHQCYPTHSTLTINSQSGDGSFSATADLTPAYRGNPAVKSWTRKLEFASRKLTVRDHFEIDNGTRAVFQINVPERPQIDAQSVTAGHLRVRVVEPTDAVISAVQWNSIDADEFSRGWRIEIAGSNDGYVVELDETD
jgi:hypothetical protein